MSCRTVLNSYHDDDDLLWKLVGVSSKIYVTNTSAFRRDRDTIGPYGGYYCKRE